MATEDSQLKLRADGDPVAEDLLREALRGSGHSPAEVLKGLRKPATDYPPWLHGMLDEWVRLGPELPSWADPVLMAAGQQFFNNQDLAICTALFTASLPSAYAGAQGVGVLARVSQLAEEGTVAQRIGETGQMLLDITKPGALEPGGVGYRRIVEVRMLHAAVRAVLLGPDAPGGAWPAADGLPVNQEDMLATLTAFTVIVFRALERMGIELSAHEQQAYLHLWAVTAALLGIVAAEQVSSLPAADRLTTELQESLQGESAAGVFLMSVLLDEMEFAMPLGCLRVPRTFVRFLVGRRVADMLQVPDAAWWSPLLPAAAALDMRLNRYPVARRIGMFPARLVGRRMIQLWIDEHRRGERRPFSVTAGQQQRWHLADDSGAVAALRRRLRTRRQRLRKARARVPRKAIAAHPGEQS